MSEKNVILKSPEEILSLHQEVLETTNYCALSALIMGVVVERSFNERTAFGQKR